MPIRVLEDHVVNQIAAGEVVERPAAVVRELVQNALDAQAQKVHVVLKAGGRAQVRVVDDGVGMDRHDALLCLERHATSKIRTADDLTLVGTLGFRGEALPSIAAVSRLDLVTVPRGADEGTRLRVEGGRLLDVAPVGAPSGTSVDVRSLFFNVPARRKFLRAVPTELHHCREAVLREALWRHEVAFHLQHDGHDLLRLAKADTLLERVVQALGEEIPWVPVRAERAGVVVEGVLAPAAAHRSTAAGLWLTVDGRPVRDPLLRRALLEAYRDALPKGRYPEGVLQVRVPPGEVDVNVHPAKIEVRFADPLTVSAAVQEAARAAVSGPSRPRQGPVGEGLLFAPRAPPAAPWLEPAPTEIHGNPPAWLDVPDELAPTATSPAPAASAPEPPPEEARAPQRAASSPVAPPVAPLPAPPDPSEAPPAPLGADRARAPVDDEPSGVAEGTAAAVFLGATGPWWVFGEGDGLLLLDAAEASRQVLFRSLRQRLDEDGGLPRDRLLAPLRCAASARSRLASAKVDLERLGFDLVEVGAALALRSVPAGLAREQAEAAALALAGLSEGARLEALTHWLPSPVATPQAARRLLAELREAGLALGPPLAGRWASSELRRRIRGG